MKIPNARALSVALHIVAEAKRLQRLIEQAELVIPVHVLPGYLRELADRLEKENEKPERPSF